MGKRSCGGRLSGTAGEGAHREVSWEGREAVTASGAGVCEQGGRGERDGGLCGLGGGTTGNDSIIRTRI